MHQIQFIDKVVDILVKQKQMSVGASGSCAESQREEEQENKSWVDEADTQNPGHESVQMAPIMGAGGSHTQAAMDQEWAKELRDIRRMVEFLVHGERKNDVKTDVARTLDLQGERRGARNQLRTNTHGPHQNREAGCRQMVCR